MKKHFSNQNDSSNEMLKRSILTLLVSSMFVLAGCGKNDSPDSILSQAKTAMAADDSRTAEIHLKNLLQANEGNLEARFLLGRLYKDAGDFRAAEKELRRAVEGGYDRNLSVPPLFDAMFQLGEQGKIISDAANMAADKPEGKAEILNWVGKAQFALGKRDEAKASFEESVKIKPDFIPGFVSLVQIRAASGDRTSAMVAIDNLLKQFPDSADGLAMKGDLVLVDGKLAEAKDLYAKVVQAKPKDALSRAKLAAIYLDLQDYPAAKIELTELGKISPNSPGTLHLKALYEFRNNNLTAALEFVLAALKVQPDYLPAVSLSGNVYLATNALEQAERAGKTLVDRQPESIQGYRLLAAAYLKMNQPERALSTVMPLIEKGVKDATLLAIAGEANLKANDPAAASKYFDAAAKLDPKDAGKRTGLALAKLAAGDKENAYLELESAVTLDSTNNQADFALIMARMRDKQYDKALEAISTLEKKQGKSPVPNNLRGMVNTAKGDFAAARQSFDAALASDAGFFPAAANLAALDLRENKPADAKKRYEAVLAKDPKNYQAYVALARHAARYGGTRDDILGYLQKAKTNNPGVVQPVLALASYYIDSGTPKDAIPLLQESLVQSPNRLETLDLLGMAYLRTNDRSQALETYNQMLQIDPKSAALHYRMGELRVALRDDNAAASSFRRAIELQPKSAEPQIALATALLRLGKRDEAQKIATNLQRDIPTNAAGLILSGDLSLAEGKLPEAVTWFKKAVALQRGTQSLVKLHGALVRSGNATEAETLLSQAIKEFPNELGLRLYAGETAISGSKWSDAVEHYKIALRQDANNGIALNNMAWAMFKLGDPKAVQVAELAFSAMPQNPAVMDTLGYINLKSGNAAKALELLKQASAMAPKAGDIRIHLAEALAQTGDKAAAKTELATVMKEFPTGSLHEQAKQIAAGL